jgi:hypothetical protein
VATTKAEKFKHAAFPGGAVDVWPKEHDGTLNYGLDLVHFKAKWDAPGEKTPDANAGFFPTMESVAARTTGKPPRDGLGNVRGGLTEHVRPITLTPGKHVFRFAQNGASGGAINVPGDHGAKLQFAPFCGPWWTTSLGFENMLARVSSTFDNSAIGVAGGKGLPLREYARKYSAVFTDWSRLEIVGMCKVLRPIRCFMGMGAKLTRSDVKVEANGIELVATETYEDANVQLYIPNLWGQIGVYLSPPQVWSPEKIDALLSKRIQDMRKQGESLSQRKRFIFEHLVSG